MPKLSDNQKSLIILGGGVLLAIGCGVMAYLDWDQKGVVEADIVAKEKTKSDNEAKINRAKPLKFEFVAYSKIVADNAKILPTAADLNQFIHDLCALEKENGLTIKSLPNIAEGKSKVPSITKIPMKLQLAATTRNFLRFMNQMENRERLITVTDFRITPAPAALAKSGQDLEHEVAVSFEVYRYDPAAAGADKDPLVTSAETTQLADQPEVKQILEKDGRPAFLEHYDLLRNLQDRRDLFVDPRRRLSGPVDGQDTNRDVEMNQLALLTLKVQKAQVELKGYRNVEKSPDFLLRSAQKEAFLNAKDDLKEALKKVSSRSPEFQNRDLMDKYIVDVKRPYEALDRDSPDIVRGRGSEGGPQGVKLSADIVRGLRDQLKALVDGRKFPEASEHYQKVDLAIRDAGKSIEESALPVVEEIRKLGERARYQAQFAQRKLDIQGVVRMQKRAAPPAGGVEAPVGVEVPEPPPETVSAVIVNGRILVPKKALDRDIVFLGVEEDGRLLFSYQGHDVDYVQPKPDILAPSRMVLEQD